MSDIMDEYIDVTGLVNNHHDKLVEDIKDDEAMGMVNNSYKRGYYIKDSQNNNLGKVTFEVSFPSERKFKMADRLKSLVAGIGAGVIMIGAMAGVNYLNEQEAKSFDKMQERQETSISTSLEVLETPSLDDDSKVLDSLLWRANGQGLSDNQDLMNRIIYLRNVINELNVDNPEALKSYRDEFTAIVHELAERGIYYDLNSYEESMSGGRKQ